MRRVLILIVFCLSSESYAYFNSARNLGFAGVGSVNADATGLLMEHNPAALSLNADLEIGAGYGRGELAPMDLTQESHYFWAKDSLASAFRSNRNTRVRNAVHDEHRSFPIAATIGFQDYRVGDLDYKAYQLSLSKMMGRKISFGVSLRYLDGRDSAQRLDKWLGDLGLVYQPFKRLNLGFSWVNFNSNSSESERLRLGLAYDFQGLVRLFFDLDHSLEDIQDKTAYGLGFEAKIREFFAFRSGYFTSEREGMDYVGTGLSFIGPRLQVHYGVKIETDTKAALHSVDLSLPLW